MWRWVQALIAAGAKPGSEELARAVASGSEQLMRALQASGVQPGCGELGTAVEAGHAGTGRALLEHGADAKCGQTILPDAFREFIRARRGATAWLSR
jgi:hypothetical protein